MTNWPNKPLIRIIRGTEYEEPIDGSLAVQEDPGGEYLLVSGPRAKNTVDPVCTRTDSIDEWEEVTAVPTAALKHLQDVFRGVELPFKRFAAIQQVVSHLPADKPSTLDRAVTRVKEVEGVVLHLANFAPEERLALLLGGLATLHAADHKTPALAVIARTCVEWANLLNPRGDALSEVKARAESDPDWGGFTVMSSLTGDVAAALDDGMSDGPMKPLLTIAQYALAWAAQIIEEEDK